MYGLILAKWGLLVYCNIFRIVLFMYSSSKHEVFEPIILMLDQRRSQRRGPVLNQH